MAPIVFHCWMTWFLPKGLGEHPRQVLGWVANDSFSPWIGQRWLGCFWGWRSTGVAGGCLVFGGWWFVWVAVFKVSLKSRVRFELF